MEEINTNTDTNKKICVTKAKNENKEISLIELIQENRKVFVKNQNIDLSNGLDKIPINFPIKNSTKLLRSKFDYKSNYIVKSYIKNGNIDEYILTKDSSCYCEGNCGKGTCDCFLNHVQRYECNNNCLCDKDKCSNRIVQKGISNKLKVEYISKEKGFGVFSVNKIKKDDFVCEYVGQIISKEKAKEKINYNLLKKKQNYVLQIRENYEKMIINTFIDAEEYGNVSRFLNHSCEPNLYFDVVRINHFIPQVAFFTSRDIDEGEELTFSYCELKDNIKYDDENSYTSYKKCLCGSNACIQFLPN